MEAWLARRAATTAGAHSMRRARPRAQTRRSTARFWNEQTGGTCSTSSTATTATTRRCGPNQLFAISLCHPVLDPSRWEPVLASVERELLTPLGLRSLAPSHPEYKRNYHGDLLTRDAAYHQGTVWSWLIGPYIDARLRVRPHDREGARRALDGLVAHLGEACVGTISEVFDAEPPYHPGGCIAQAWGVAELLRCLLATSV